LDRKDGALGIGDRLPLGRLADKALAVIGKGDDRGRSAHALRVLDDFWGFAFHDGNARIRGAEVDADDLAHSPSVLSSVADRPGPSGTRNEGCSRCNAPPLRPPEFKPNAAVARRCSTYRRARGARKPADHDSARRRREMAG